MRPIVRPVAMLMAWRNMIRFHQFHRKRDREEDGKVTAAWLRRLGANEIQGRCRCQLVPNPQTKKGSLTFEACLSNVNGSMPKM